MFTFLLSLVLAAQFVIAPGATSTVGLGAQDVSRGASVVQQTRVIAQSSDQQGCDWQCMFGRMLSWTLHYCLENPDDCAKIYRSITSRTQSRSGIDPSEIRQLIVSSPYMTVRSDLPCAGPQTVKVQYKKYGSFDCVDPTKYIFANLGGAYALFVATVDSQGSVNNAQVYQYNDAAVTFLGTVTYSNHHGFTLVTENGPGAVASFTDDDGSKKRCYIGWSGKYSMVCEVANSD